MSTSEDDMVVERLRVDRGLFAELLTARDVGAALSAAGLSPSAPLVELIDVVVGKSRTYISDQVHVIEAKLASPLHERGVSPLVHSGNGCQDW
jgi:hypothetical protein